MKNTFSTVHSKLDEFINRYYGITTLRGLILFVSTSAFLIVVLALAVFFTDASVGARTTLFLAFCAALLFQLFSWIVKPLFKRIGVFPRMTYMAAAKKIEEINSDVGEKIINGLELESFNQNSELIVASLDQLTEELSVFKGTNYVNFKRVRQVVWTIIPFVLAAILVVVSGNIENVLSGTDRLVSFRSEFLPSDYVAFKLVSKEEVPEGKDYRLSIELSSKELPDIVKIFVNGIEVSAFRDNGRVYSSTVRSVYDDFSVYCEAGRYRSKDWNIEVIKKAKIFNFLFDVTPPAYTRLDKFVSEGNSAIVVPENSVVNWRGNVLNTNSFKIRFDSTHQEIVTKESDQTFNVKRTINKSETWGVMHNNEPLANYSVQILKDNYPTIRVEHFKDSSTINGVYFSGLVSDDYGFKSLNVIQKSNTTGKVVKERIELSNTKKQSFFIYRNIDEDVSVYFEVRDNDAHNGFKKSTSNTFRISSADRKEFKDEIGSNKAENKSKIEERLKELKATKSKDEQSSKSELKDQQKSLEDIKSLSEKFREQLDLEKANDLYDEDIVKKQEQLEERFDELDKDLQELLKEIERLEKELNKNSELQESVEIKKEDVIDELDRMMEMLDRLQFEKDLEDAISDLEKLEDAQKELSEKSDESVEEQLELNEEFEEVSEEVEKLQERSKDLEMGDLDEIKKQDSDQVKEEMDKAQMNQSKKSNKKANENQKKATEGIKEMKEKLQSAQSEMNASQQAENAEDLRMLLDNLLVLSKEEEALQQSLKQMAPDSPEYPEKISNQAQLSKDYKIIEDSLSALMVRAPEIETQVLKEMNTIERYFKKSSSSLKDNKVKVGVGEIRYLLTSVNNLALMLNVSLESMQSQMSQQKSGDKSCNKPGSGKPGMSELKQRQQQLSKQAGEMQKEFGGSKPSEEKGEGGQKGNKSGRGSSKGEQIAKMLGEQEMIRKGLEKEGVGTEGTGELDELLRKNEEDIANRNFDGEFFERQKEIETKMLESEKASLEREQDNMRESSTNEDEYERKKREAEREYLQKKHSGFEHINWDKLLLSPFYENKILDEHLY